MTELITFVCWGNICRSPMGEQVARKWAAEAGLATEFDSAGVSAEERGNPIDRRAARVLAEHGYAAGNHRAKQIDVQLIGRSALVLGFEPMHLTRLRQLSPDAENLRLVTDFDPDAAPGSGIADPWYGGLSDFEETLAAIEAAMPALLAELRQLKH